MWLAVFLLNLHLWALCYHHLVSFEHPKLRKGDCGGNAQILASNVHYDLSMTHAGLDGINYTLK